MTQDEIIEMAKESGICSWLKPPKDVKERLVAFANLVADKEREACAKVCETINSLEDYYGERIELACAESIRARGYKQDGQCKRCTDGCPACDSTKLPKEAHDLF